MLSNLPDVLHTIIIVIAQTLSGGYDGRYKTCVLYCALELCTTLHI